MIIAELAFLLVQANLPQAAGDQERLLTDQRTEVMEGAVHEEAPEQTYGFVIPADGELLCWVLSRALDPMARIDIRERQDCSHEDQDSGGSTTPRLYHKVKAGEHVRITVKAEPGELPSTGAFSLYVAYGPRASDEYHEELRLLLEDANALLASGNREELEILAEETIRGLADQSLDLDGVNACSSLALLAYQAGKFEQSAAAYRLATEYAARHLPPTDPIPLGWKNNLIQALNQLGRGQEALSVATELRDATVNALPPLDTMRLTCEATFGSALLNVGQMEQARDCYISVVERRKQVLPADDATLLRARRNLAACEYALGNIMLAVIELEDLIEIQARALPADAPELALTRSTLAECYRGLGDDDLALSTSLDAFRAVEKYPANDPVRINAETNLAVALASTGRHGEAVPRFESVIAALSESPRAKTVDMWIAQQGLAGCLSEQGDRERARDIMSRVLERQLEVFPAKSMYVRTARDMLAELQLRMGRFDESEALCKENLALVESMPDPLNQHGFTALHKLASIALQREELQESEEWALRLAARMRAAVASAILTRPARQVTAISAGLDLYLSSVLYLLLGDEGSKRRLEAPLEKEAFAAVEETRALYPTALRIERSIARQNFAAVEPLRKEVMEASAKISSASTEQDLQDALGQRESAEGKILAILRTELVAPLITCEAVGQALHDKEGVLTFRVFEVSTTDTNLERSGRSERLRYYAATVVTKEGALMHALGAAEPLEQEVAAWLDAIRSQVTLGQEANDLEAEIRLRGHAAFAAVVEPLMDELRGLERLCVVADGILHEVPMDALPVGEGYLGDSMEITTIPSLDFLMRWGNGETVGNDRLLLVGDVDYDAGHAREASSYSDLPQDALRSALGAGRFEPLPHAREEIDAILGVYRAAFPGRVEPHVLARADATRVALLDELQNAGFVHIATHDFVVSTPRARAAFGPSDSSQQGNLTPQLSPLSMRGLALAGANPTTGGPAASAGVVTGQELSARDLQACRLAVLSACRSNVGIARPGEGVYSLQMALHAAGVRTAITSLWRVPDRGTSLLMGRFYTNLFVRKERTATALWAAKRELRESGKPTSHWAGWVLSGNPD